MEYPSGYTEIDPSATPPSPPRLPELWPPLPFGAAFHLKLLDLVVFQQSLPKNRGYFASHSNALFQNWCPILGVYLITVICNQNPRIWISTLSRVNIHFEHPLWISTWISTLENRLFLGFEAQKQGIIGAMPTMPSERLFIWLLRPFKRDPYSLRHLRPILV